MNHLWTLNWFQNKSYLPTISNYIKNEMILGLGTLILQENTLQIYYLSKKNRMEISVLATTFTIIVERKHKYIYILYFVLPFLKVQSLLENKKYKNVHTSELSFLPSWRSYWGCLLLRKINNILLKIQTKMKSQDNKDWFRLRVNGLLLEVFLARYSACHKTSCGCVLVLLLLLCVGEPAFTNKIFENKLFCR